MPVPPQAEVEKIFINSIVDHIYKINVLMKTSLAHYHISSLFK
jgi:hypothetical protein